MHFSQISSSSAHSLFSHFLHYFSFPLFFYRSFLFIFEFRTEATRAHALTTFRTAPTGAGRCARTGDRHPTRVLHHVRRHASIFFFCAFVIIMIYLAVVNVFLACVPPGDACKNLGGVFCQAKGFCFHTQADCSAGCGGPCCGTNSTCPTQLDPRCVTCSTQGSPYYCNPLTSFPNYGTTPGYCTNFNGDCRSGYQSVSSSNCPYINSMCSGAASAPPAQ